MEETPQTDAARFPFDAIYKALCCHRQTVADMFTGFLAEPAGPLPRPLVDALDLGRARKLSMEWATREFRVRRGDQVWEVPFRESAQAEGYPPFLLVNLEFQSRRDGLMALRFAEQGNELYRELRAQGAVAEGEPCPVLCVVLHNGRSPWTAPLSTAALVNAPPALGRATVPLALSAIHPWGYHPLDFVAHRDRPHVAGNVLSMMVGIEFARDRADLVAPLWETVRNLADEELRDAVARWLGRMKRHYNMDLPGLEELLAMEDVTVLTSRLDETIEEWRREAVTEGESRGLSRGRSEGRSEGLSQGRSEGRSEGLSEGTARCCSGRRRGGSARRRRSASGTCSTAPPTGIGSPWPASRSSRPARARS